MILGGGAAAITAAFELSRPGLAGALREHHRVPGRLAPRRQGRERARPPRAHRGARPAPLARLLRKRLPRHAGLLCGAGPPAGCPARALGRRVQEVEPRRARGSAPRRLGALADPLSRGRPCSRRAASRTIRRSPCGTTSSAGSSSSGAWRPRCRCRTTSGAPRICRVTTASARCASGSGARSGSWRIGRATPSTAPAWRRWSPRSRSPAASSPSPSITCRACTIGCCACSSRSSSGCATASPVASTWTTACTASGSSSRSSWPRSVAS